MEALVEAAQLPKHAASDGDQGSGYGGRFRRLGIRRGVIGQAAALDRAKSRRRRPEMHPNVLLCLRSGITFDHWRIHKPQSDEANVRRQMSC